VRLLEGLLSNEAVLKLVNKIGCSALQVRSGVNLVFFTGFLLLGGESDFLEKMTQTTHKTLRHVVKQKTASKLVAR